MISHFTQRAGSDKVTSLLKLKKYCSLILVWTLSLVFSFVPSSASLTEIDASDDFSFSLDYSSKEELYQFMSEEVVSELLSDRLDLFPKSQVSRFARHILSLCKRYRLDPAYVLSLIDVESGFRIKAVSPAGAMGLMQLKLSTAQYVIRDFGIHFSGFENFKGYSLAKQDITQAQLLDPFVNTAIGISYLAWLRDYYEGFSPYYILAAYNVGPTRMNELLAQKSFTPVETKKYFLAIRRGVPSFRFYRKSKLAFRS